MERQASDPDLGGPERGLSSQIDFTAAPLLPPGYGPISSDATSSQFPELEAAPATLTRPYLYEDERGIVDGSQVLVEPTSVDLRDALNQEASSLLADVDRWSQFTGDTANTGASSAVVVTKLPPCYASIRLAPIALFYGLAAGIVGPVTTELVKSRVCEQQFGFSNSTCASLNDPSHKAESDLVTSSTAHYAFLLNLAGSLPCVFFAIFTGSWSDHFGRKIPMIVPFCGMLMSAVLLILFAYVPTHPAVLLVYPFVSAAFGGWIIAAASLYSYLGDYSSPASLAVDMAVFDGVLGLAANIGNIVGGVLYGLYGFPYPFILYAGLLAITIIYTTIAIRDRRVLVRQFHTNNWRKLFTSKNLKDNGKMLAKERLGKTRLHIHLIVLCLVLMLCCSYGNGSITQLFFEHAPLSWTTKHYTLFSAMTGIITGLLMMAAVPLFKNVLMLKDSAIGIIGIVSTILSLIILSGTTQTWLAIASATIGAFSGVQYIAVRTLLSNWVDEDERGKMMSLFGAFQAVMPILGSFIFTSVFSASVSWWPGFSYALASILLLPALGAFCYIDMDRRGTIYGAEEGARHTKLQ